MLKATLIATIPFALFCVPIAICRYETGWKMFRNITIALIISFALSFSIVGGCYWQDNIDTNTYNNGICKYDETPYHFVNASRYHGSITYYYECENGHVIETQKSMNG